MKSYWIWIRQALIPLAVTYGVPVLILLTWMIDGELDFKSFARFIMAYGMAFSFLMSPMMMFNPVYLALSLGETRKGAWRGLMLSRILYAVVMAVTASFVLWYCDAVVDAGFLLILVTYLGLQLTMAGIGGLTDCLLLRLGRKYIYLALIILFFSIPHVLLMMIVGEFPFVSGIALAEGLILAVVSAYVQKKTLNTWNVQA